MSYSGPDYEFDKEIDLDVDFDFDADVDVEVDVDTEVYVDVDSDVDLEDNVAILTFDAEALGEDTLVEVDVVVLTVENELSSVTGSIVVASD